VSEEVPQAVEASPAESPAVVAQPEASQAAADSSISAEGVAAAPGGAPARTAADDAWPTVAWNSWNGEVDSLPNQYHDSARGISDYYEKSYSEKADEISTLRSMYAAMLSEDEDPRVGSMGKELEELRSQLDERNVAYTDLEKTLSTTEDRAVVEYVDRFWLDHKELSEDKKTLEIFSSFLVEENEYGGMWDAYIAAELVSLPKEALQVAIDAKKDGVADEYALRLAKAHAQLAEVKSQPVAPSVKEVAAAQAKAAAEAKAKAPRTGAKITNGAVRSARPQVARKTVNDANSLDEMRLLAARRAFSVHGGGRR
jgi:hypothetical protein|tara:strand:- start:1126 stop:2064 length:939 start_codon:yes stop_codon:yes gene_type:complete